VIIIIVNNSTPELQMVYFVGGSLMSNEYLSSKCIGEKLGYIRDALKLTQVQMIDYLGLRESATPLKVSRRSFDRSYISVWEHSKTEPPVNVLLRYAHLGGVSVDAFVDDLLKLPSQERIREYRAGARKLNHKHPSSKRLGEKLRSIRSVLNLSQIDMIDLLGLMETYDRAYVSFWENNKIELPLIALRGYANAGGVSLHALADDGMEFILPPHLYRSADAIRSVRP
jgi:transcriptional regulator with XRE-family HTH domain